MMGGGVSSAPWLPTDIAGCVLWLRSDLGITKDGSDRVSQWADQSGQNNHASQATEAKQPVWTADQYQGLPGLYFDGTDDYMTHLLNMSASCSVFAIAKTTRDQTWQQLVQCTAPQGNVIGHIIAQAGESANWGFYFTMPVNTSYSLINTWRRLGAIVINYDNVIAITDSNAEETLTSGTGWYSDDFERRTLGAALHPSGQSQQLLQGYIVEIIVYNSALSSSNRVTVMSYLIH